MKSHFKLLSERDGVRAGELRTPAGKVLTPTFMPDGTRGAVKSLTPEQVESTGVQVVLSNTYHLHLQPGEATVAALGGLHEFSRRRGPILTDSGGFQVFSLAKIRKITEEGVHFKDPKTGDMNFLSPETSIGIQLKLGADMLVAFDDVTALDDRGRARTREAFDRTHRWLERSLAEFQRLTKSMPDEERPLLFGVVQGGLDKDLRLESLRRVQALPVDGIAIGGLSVGETRAEMHTMLAHLSPHYDPARPHFLLGVGDPVDLRFAIEHGIDMLDCVLPTRNARHGTAWVRQPCTCAKKSGKAELVSASRAIIETSLECKTCGAGDKKIHLTNAAYAEDRSVIDPACDCTTCLIPHHTCVNGSEQRSIEPENSSTPLLVPTGTTRQMSELPGTTARRSSSHCPRCGEVLSGYSRGFLRHQFKVGEPLAGSLVSIHNIRYLERICEEYRGK